MLDLVVIRGNEFEIEEKKKEFRVQNSSKRFYCNKNKEESRSNWRMFIQKRKTNRKWCIWSRCQVHQKKVSLLNGNQEGCLNGHNISDSLAVKDQDYYEEDFLQENGILEKLKGEIRVQIPLMTKKYEVKNGTEDDVKLLQVFDLMDGDLSKFHEKAEKNVKFKEMKLTVVRKMVEALKQTHSKDILHFDIKLENYLYSIKGDEPDVKITDFGLSLDLEKSQFKQSNNAIYFPPEVHFANFEEENKKMRVSKSIDVYMLSLAIVSLLTPLNKGRFYLYTKANKSTLHLIIEEIKRKLSSKEQKVVELVVNEIIVPVPEKRILLDQLLEKVDAIISSDQVEATKITKNKYKKAQGQTFSNYLKMKKAFN